MEEDDLRESSEEELVSDEVVEMVNACVCNVRREQVTRVSSVKDALGDSVIILDNGATVSVFKNQKLFKTLRALEPICIDGVEELGSGVKTSTGGDTVFGESYFTRKVIGNILSYGCCVDSMYSVDYDKASDTFILQPSKDGASYRFPRDSATNLYLCDLGRQARVMPATVSENLRMFTKREIARAEKARRYQSRSGVVTSGDLIKRIVKGKIRNIDVNAEDVARSVQIWGKDLANLKGKTTARTPPVVIPEYIDPSKLYARKRQVMYADIMFVNGKSYLIAVFAPLGYVEVKKLKSKGNKDVLSAVLTCVSYLRKKGFVISVMRSDGESAIDSDFMRAHLDFDVDTTDGEHVPVIERKIRTVKERVRGIVNTLPFQLTEQLEEWLVHYVI